MSKQSLISTYKLMLILKRKTDKLHPLLQKELRETLGEELTMEFKHGNLVFA